VSGSKNSNSQQKTKLTCPKCGSEEIQDEQFRYTKRFYYCLKCNYGSFDKRRFLKREAVVQ